MPAYFSVVMDFTWCQHILKCWSFILKHYRQRWAKKFSDRYIVNRLWQQLILLNDFHRIWNDNNNIWWLLFWANTFVRVWDDVKTWISTKRKRKQPPESLFKYGFTECQFKRHFSVCLIFFFIQQAPYIAILTVSPSQIQRNIELSFFFGFVFSFVSNANRMFINVLMFHEMFVCLSFCK